MEKIGELRQKLDCYSGLLFGYAGSIKSQIEIAEQELMANLARSPQPEPETEQQPEPALA